MSTSPTPSSPRSTPTSTTTSAPSSTSTGPASSPPRSSAPPAGSHGATGRKMSPRPTNGSRPCPAPKTSSGSAASPSTPSINARPQPTISTPPKPPSTPATNSSAPSARPATPWHDPPRPERCLPGDPPTNRPLPTRRLPLSPVRRDNETPSTTCLPLIRASPLTLQNPRVQAHLRVGKDSPPPKSSSLTGKGWLGAERTRHGKPEAPATNVRRGQLTGGLAIRRVPCFSQYGYSGNPLHTKTVFARAPPN